MGQWLKQKYECFKVMHRIQSSIQIIFLHHSLLSHDKQCHGIKYQGITFTQRHEVIFWQVWLRGDLLLLIRNVLKRDMIVLMLLYLMISTEAQNNIINIIKSRNLQPKTVVSINYNLQGFKKSYEWSRSLSLQLQEQLQKLVATFNYKRAKHFCK